MNAKFVCFIEEDNWLIQLQKEVATFERGKAMLKQWILNKLEFVNLDQFVLKYIDPAKQKFGLSIISGKRIYVEYRKQYGI